MLLRLAFVVGAGLSLLRICSARTPSEHVTDGYPDKGKQDLRSCSVSDLLPMPAKGISSEWSDEYVIDLPYNGTCASTKARYVCPNRDSPEYPKWEPMAVTQGLCRSATPSNMSGGPFPPNSKILLYGNSHMRQVVEAIMCMFQDEITSKRVHVGSPREDADVPGDTQCRACSVPAQDKSVNGLQRLLLANHCITGASDCRCDDDKGEFFFPNGSVVHFKFGDRQTKSLDDARKDHGMDPLSSYDAIFMNPGNGVAVNTESAIKYAAQVQEAGTAFFWLCTYSGSGRISTWSDNQRKRFVASGARYVNIQSMAQGMKAWTKGTYDGTTDGHFCLPGPPNEIALLLLKIIWAVHDETNGP